MHALEVKLYEEFTAADSLGMKLICTTIGDMYTLPLKNENTEYATVTTKGMMAHLNDEYCDVDKTVTILNPARLSAAYDPNLLTKLL